MRPTVRILVREPDFTEPVAIDRDTWGPLTIARAQEYAKRCTDRPDGTTLRIERQRGDERWTEYRTYVVQAGVVRRVRTEQAAT